MPILEPDLGRQMVEFNRRVAESAKAGWRPRQAENAASLRRKGTRAARELTRVALSRGSDAGAYWEGALEVIEEGVRGEEAREAVRVVRDIIDSWLALAQKARELWQDVAAATGATPEGLDELDAAEAEVMQVKSAAEKTYTFLSRARPPVDPGRLEKGQEEIAQGRYRTAEQIRADYPEAKGEEG
jgi:hypothetical protein